MWQSTTVSDHPARRDGLIAVVLLVLPWLLGWAFAPGHRFDTTTVTIVLSVSIPLSGLWLAWAALRNSSSERREPQWSLGTGTTGYEHQDPQPARRGPLVFAVVAVALLLALGGYLIGTAGNHTGAQGNGHSPATGSQGSTESKSYTLKYNGASFALNGGGCQNGDIVIPAFVTFTGTGPDVTSTSSFGVLPGTSNGDLELECELGDGNTNPGITFSGDQAAEVTGTPGPSACELAITRNPLSGGIEFTALSTGMQFCIDAASGLLVRVTLVGVNETAYNLSWKATAWSAPGSG